MSKEERIKAKQDELMEILADVDNDRMKIASDLIKQAAFMSATLEDLADVINSEGVTETYTNGQNQSGRKISSNAKMYATLVSKYEQIISKLLKLVPEKKSESRPLSVTPDIKSYNAEAKKIDRQRAKEMAFFEALKNGDIQQSDYHVFCEEWERQHA